MPPIACALFRLASACLCTPDHVLHWSAIVTGIMSSAVTAENSDANGDATEQKIEGDPEAAAVIEESPSEQSA